ncbi:hypothetical protein [Mucilaginibacter ginsenosidivorax]|uniref:hypothetical protein n=1 Tax=Mucilaginibacter ginsenosidivorax TaxID=862126 RepID=UPI0013157507|nr:hypothetical protein [Mucilaginibacter ginsenosidivorax]
MKAINKEGGVYELSYRRKEDQATSTATVAKNQIAPQFEPMNQQICNKATPMN